MNELHVKYIPLLEATYFARADLVAEMIAAGADLEVVNASGDTALHVAATNGRLEIARQLLAAGAQVGVRNLDGYLPLHKAAFHGRTEIATALIGAGADVGQKDSAGRAASEIARQRNHYALADLLGAAAQRGRATVYLQPSKRPARRRGL